MRPSQQQTPGSGVAVSSPWIHLQDVPKGREEKRREEERRDRVRVIDSLLTLKEKSYHNAQQRVQHYFEKREERREKREKRREKKEERREGESWSQTATHNPISPLSGGDRDLGRLRSPGQVPILREKTPPTRYTFFLHREMLLRRAFLGNFF